MNPSCFLLLALVSAYEWAENFDKYFTTTSTTTQVFYAPNPGLDPYWVGGEWVHGTITTTGTTKETTPFRHKRTLVCGRLCPYIYRILIGKVCVHNLTHVFNPAFTGGWESPNWGRIDYQRGGVLDRNYEYLETLDSYCQFLDKQCRANTAHGYGYAFLHMGPCVKDQDAFPNLMSGDAVRQRKRKAIRDYNDRLQPGRSNGARCDIPCGTHRVSVQARESSCVSHLRASRRSQCVVPCDFSIQNQDSTYKVKKRINGRRCEMRSSVTTA
ncbi:uncharacterized protein LOC134799712 [Cydia splendana]|uniref:uncharacterized protein LOC134799712 n=1 Tax=Cydia splendana TaxID=1100963 RepID=UPI00300C464C